MLIFPNSWRFESPGELPEQAVQELMTLAKQIAGQGGTWDVYETFKSNFAAAVGESVSRSSSTDWAATDMFTYMQSLKNAPLFVQAFYDACEQLRAAGNPVPDLAYINGVLRRTKTGFEIRPPDLLSDMAASVAAESSGLFSSVDRNSSSPPEAKRTPSDPIAHAKYAVMLVPHQQKPVIFDKPTCFVIQPFDKGPYDKRFDEVLAPAIKAAGLEPYRVDKDVAAATPIEAIELGIRAAVVCLSDITTDNPNVWYELGFAYVSGTPVVMVCAEVRAGKQYPFDIQHRSVFSYALDSPGDFKRLEDGVTQRLKAAMNKGAAIIQLADAGQVVASVSGLSQPEMTVIALLAGSRSSPTGTYRLASLRVECERAGLTALGVTMGIRKLNSKGFVIMTTEQESYTEDLYEALRIDEKGWEWMEANEAKFSLLRGRPDEDNDDRDIPF